MGRSIYPHWSALVQSVALRRPRRRRPSRLGLPRDKTCDYHLKILSAYRPELCNQEGSLAFLGAHSRPRTSQGSCALHG